MRPRRTPEPRGSTLVLVTVLLLVLSVIGVAAVRLSAQERVNAAAKGFRDQLVACANAARLQLWAEISRAGPGYLRSSDPAVEITLPDGTVLTAPAHFTFAGKDAKPVAELVSVTPMFTAKASGGGDMTNRMVDPRKLEGSAGNRILARCKDPKGRELLVEFTTKFALF